MKHLFKPVITIRLFYFAAIFCFVIIFNGCRKDHVNQTANPQALTTIDAHIPQLKELYANGVKAHSKATQSTGKWYNDLINSIEVDWNSYTLQKRNDSSIVAEFEMKNDSGLYTLKQLDGKYRNKTTVVFIEHKDGSRLSFFAKVIEDLSIPGSETVLDELHYRNIPGLFNGMIFYYTLDRQFVNGERYVNGVRTGSVSFKETASGIKVNSESVNNVVAPCTITDFYSYNCQKLPSGELIDCVYHYLGSVESGNCHGDGDGGSGGYGGDGSGGGVPADPKPCIPAKPNTVDMTEVVKNGKLVIQSMPAPGTGGGTTPTNGPCVIKQPPVTSINLPFNGPKVDPKKETKCFDKSQPAKVTIFVQQPNPNTRDMIGANSVGHTFIGITQGGVTRNFGFYPDSPNAAVLSSQNSEIHDNSSELYHVSISKSVTPTQLTNVINYINNYPPKYTLATYNCTDFAIAAAGQAGLVLPITTGTTNQLGFTFTGRNPGDLGQDMRNMTLPSGTVRSQGESHAPTKSGTCP